MQFSTVAKVISVRSIGRNLSFGIKTGESGSAIIDQKPNDKNVIKTIQKFYMPAQVIDLNLWKK
jgi:hypothetical protein